MIQCSPIILLGICLAAPPSQPPAPGSRPGPQIDAWEGLPVVGWEDARPYLGQRCVVQGQFVATRNIGRFCFLNFDDVRTRRFTVVIRREDLPNFPAPPDKTYFRKWVRVRGTVGEFEGRLEMIVRRPDQIQILDAPPPASAPASAVAAARQPTPGRLTVATYNVLNLFDDLDDPYFDDEGTPAKPREQLERLAATIRTLDADVVALQEVENRGYLERFVQAFLPDAGYREVVQFEGNDLRGIDCAVLSRFPVGPVTSHRHLTFDGPDGRPMRFLRDLLLVRLLPPGGPPLDLYVVHLKSKRSGDGSDAIRLAEAHAVRALLDQRLAADREARFLVCGDFNDTWESAAVQAIVGAGPNALASAVAGLPAGQCITYNPPPYRSMIDFILCSPALRPRLVPDSATILQGSPAATGSDHNPVLVAMTWP